MFSMLVALHLKSVGFCIGRPVQKVVCYCFTNAEYVYLNQE